MEDEELLQHLERLVNERPPPRAMDAAYRSRAWADLDMELAELVADSAATLAGVRSDADRRLTYECSMGVMVIEIDPSARVVRGQIGPAAAAVSIERSDGSTAPIVGTTADDARMIDSFELTDAEPGPARLRIDSDAGAWRTGWFTLP